MNIIPLKVVPLGSHTPPETLLPLPVAELEVFMWKCLQLVCHDLWMLSTVKKLRSLRRILSFGKRKKPHEHRSGEYGVCGNTGLPFLVKNLFTEMAV